MKVCLLNDSFPPVIDGVVNVMMNYADYMMRDYDAQIMVGTPEYPDTDYSVYPYEVVAYPSFDTSAVTNGYRAGNPLAGKAVSRLVDFMPDIIHSHCPSTATIVARLMREQTGAPIIFTYHTKYDIDIRRAVKIEAIAREGIKAMVGNIEACDDIWVVSRYGNLRFWRASATMLAASYIFQRGTPFLYQGQELGMTNIELDSIDKYLDVASKNAYNTFHLREPVEKRLRRIQISTRDSARTPVQWSDAPGAGFTSGTPWFYINPNYVKINAEAEEKNPYSVLNFYRKCLSLRKSEDTLLWGSYREYFPLHPKLYMYERRYKGEVILVVCSFSDKPLGWKLPRNLSGRCGFGRNAELLLANYPVKHPANDPEANPANISADDSAKDSAKKIGDLKKGTEKAARKQLEICRPLRPYEAQVWRIGI